MATASPQQAPPTAMPPAPPRRADERIGQFVVGKRERDPDEPYGVGKIVRSDDEMVKREARLKRLIARIRELQSRLSSRGIVIDPPNHTQRLDLMTEEQLNIFLAQHESRVEAEPSTSFRLEKSLKEMTKKDR